jgi:hypothetical protein
MVSSLLHNGVAFFVFSAFPSKAYKWVDHYDRSSPPWGRGESVCGARWGGDGDMDPIIIATIADIDSDRDR